MSFGNYPCELCGAATLNTTYCDKCNGCEHEFVPWCMACGTPMDTTGEPPVCHGCGNCYEAPRICEICGLDEADYDYD